MNGYSSYGYGANGHGIDPSYAAGDTMMMGTDPATGQSLEDIVSQNAKAIRRQSMPQGYGASPAQVDADMRRISMLDYSGTSPATSVNGFAYDPTGSMDQNGMMAGASPAQQMSQPRRGQEMRQSSHGNLGVTSNYNGTPQSYTPMMPPNSAYASPAHPQNGMDLGINSPYADPNMGMSMDFSMDPNMSTALVNDMNMSMYSQPQFSSATVASPMHSTAHQAQSAQSIAPPHPPLNHSNSNSGMNTQYSTQSSQSGGSTVRALSRSNTMPDVGSTSSPLHPQGSSGRQPGPTAQTAGGAGGPGFHARNQSLQIGTSRLDHGGSWPQGQQQSRNTQQQYDGVSGPVPIDTSTYNPNNQGFNWEAPEGGWPSTMVGRPHSMQLQHKNAYSSTGFDMLGVLMRVATRPKPEINIGPVDLSCAFVVCDAEKDDIPIVYCSDNFERLTGYNKHMILGRNCRFLQSPDGNVAPGIRRKYVDDDSVLYLKNMIALRREAQISLINYRRGGQPFMNLLTMIPITWDSDNVKFFVGFQVDLVEQPNAVTNKNPDGSYSINYQRGMPIPRYVINAPESMPPKSELGQTVPRDDVSAILTSIGTGESEYAKRMWDKVLLENTDDVVHVLSLKGLFQWVSPSAIRVLEYEPHEIIGTALSSVCHPSDIVPVTRELKDTSSGASVNVVFRIRRKNSGYMWFEGHGSLHTEQGKGRKSIIMVGRERPVYALSKNEIVNNGGIGENELWTKMSTSGMFLFVGSNVRQLLDRQPDELIGISIQSLMRAESKVEFARILEHARTGKIASVKHEMINRRGQVMSAFTTLYPGDATEGLKPTFIMAQTRLVKFSRSGPSGRPSIYPKTERNSNDSSSSIKASGSQAGTPLPGNSTPASGLSMSNFQNTNGSAATFAGEKGLLLGHQDISLASDDNLFDELKTTKSSSWQYEIRQLEKRNRMLAEEVQSLIAAKKKRKRRKNGGNLTKDCANCHTKVTPEWRRGPSGQRDLCNSCGLRWAKLNGRVSPRTNSQRSAHSGGASDKGASPRIESATALGPSNRSPLGMSGATPAHSQQTQSGGASGNTNASSGHAANMEGASGVPAKIDEGIEPD
ncbi:hypothetical protein EJ03DRAFT_75051 [Teratosphaeria nubilosa]|uniref:White collar 1 protein n=1 Tax=Teratosphaeria nubilosa TaxID=161662 RepID=A0A6G1LN57_9PEZI|nr:hypothetical protein EJ03DRAFT_75051 [Teratosphaeria nubilosa]